MNEQDKSEPRCCFRVLSDVASPPGTKCWCAMCGKVWLRVNGVGWKMIDEQNGEEEPHAAD